MSNTIKFFTLVFSEGLNVLVGILFLPYLARAMSITEYGTYGQVLLIVSLFQGVFAFGLTKVIFAFLANENYSQSESFYSNLITIFLSGCLATIIILLLNPLFANQFKNLEIVPLLNIYAWVLPFILISTSINASLIYFDIVKPSASISVVCNLIKVFFVIISIQIYQSLPLVFISILIVEPLRVYLLYRYVPQRIKSNFSISLKNCLEQIHVGWPLGLASLIGVLFYSVDGFMVSTLLNVNEYAIYKNGAFQIPFIASVYSAIGAILLPDISKLYFKKDFKSIVHLKRKAITNSAMLIFPPIIFCIIFAKPLIVIYLSEKYIQSYPIFMIYNLILLARITSYDELFVATNNNSKMPPIYFIALILNILLNCILIHALGSLGAAVASVFSFYFLISVLLRKGVKFINCDISDFFETKKLLLAFIICFVIGIVLSFLNSLFVGNHITLALFLGFYLLIMYHILVRYKFVSEEIINSFISRLGNSKIKLLLTRLYA